MKYFFLLYSLLWKCAIPLLKNHKRLKYGFDERLAKVDYNTSDFKTRPLLVYAASGGEALLAHCFIERQIREGKVEAGQVYYCFSWTKEGVETFKKLEKHALIQEKNIDIRVFYAPFDKPDTIYKALKIINPQTCYIIETEIWFGLLKALHSLDIPFHFVNARMTAKTLKSLSRFSWILKKFPPESVSALSQHDLNAFSTLFDLPKDAEKFFIQENLKFDIARHLVKEAQNTIFESLPVPVVLFASIRTQEEELILSCVQELQSLHKDIALIICPKQVDRAVFWQENLQDEKTICVSKAQIKSQDLNQTLLNGTRIFIWDTFGELRNLYAQADMVYVGGSLVPLGGQNFLEALAYGLKPYVGKYVENFAWVFDKNPNLRSTGLLQEVATIEELTKAFSKEILSFNRENILVDKKKNQKIFAEWLG